MDDPKPALWFTPAVEPPAEPFTALWFMFKDAELLVRIEPDGSPAIPSASNPRVLGLEPVRWQYLGTLADRHCCSAELPVDAGLPPSMELRGLRSLYGAIPEDQFWAAARAVQIVDWDRCHQFCGRCGERTAARKTERARECPACKTLTFPRLAPAVIVRIDRGDEILMSRAPQFPPGMYSVIAGFVEPGETLEQAAAREIREEVGLDVTDLRYFASQPWPFPHSLMLAFTARYASGEIHVDRRELEDARWFRGDHMPQIPGPISVSRRLIDDYLDRFRASRR